MQLGFVSAILPDHDLEGVFRTAADIGYDCVELMCWPPGEAERRYAGVRHVDVSRLDGLHIERIKFLQMETGVSISALGYYPNPLSADREANTQATDHLETLMRAAVKLGVDTVTTFVGRDKDRTIEAQWGDFLSTWKPLVRMAGGLNLKLGIENCPMRFTADEWPGGNNLAVSPAVWEQMWEDIPDAHWGLNYDPSHLVLMHMDYTLPLRKYPERLVHVHAKDLRIDTERLNHYGTFAHPGLWHTPKLPGLGDVNWSRFFSYLTDAGYDGPVCVEVEDRAFEGSDEKRIEALRLSHDYLRQFIPRKR